MSGNYNQGQPYKLNPSAYNFSLDVSGTSSTLSPHSPRLPHFETELPTLVNSKQYRRIIKRREARSKLVQLRSLKIQKLKKSGSYIHESRHKHAMKRPRGEGGRFLTKDELEVYYKKNPGEKSGGGGKKYKKTESGMSNASGASSVDDFFG
ncbi:hypothetical protein TrLO_g4974 [Triparma laevis f. longispina]|uniref:Nuclear transcription factor Y subunit n=1 Tax=Triparma laevis f. longispina TaxID=1714387 RepID=A0A9W7ACJ5_9STRA|nr:hypothetical protein TrLO_g4974 [Triparma laevis f. longispina]